MDRWLIGLDVDGTILHHDGHLSPEVVRAVREVREAGHHVVIATGRSVLSATPVAHQLGITNGLMVCSNGAVTVELTPDAEGGWRLVEEVTFTPRTLLERLARLHPDARMGAERVGHGFAVNQPFPEWEDMDDRSIVPWCELCDTPTSRITFRAEVADEHQLLSEVADLGLHGVTYDIGEVSWMDVTPEGVTKAAGMEQVRRLLKVEPHLTFAAGDMDNDKEMLAWAARGVAMGQASPQVQACADEVTAPIEEDGLARVLDTLPR